MGILNITPDSFSDGNLLYNNLEKTFNHAVKIYNEGADIIDIGGESTRPNAQAVSVQEELDRVIPIIDKLSKELPVKISIDTNKTEVMREAIKYDVNMINDINALQAKNSLEIIAKHNKINICLMHMLGKPRTMQQNPQYKNIITEIKNFLQQRILACENAGITKSRLIIDVGFGFGKTLAHNLTLIQNLPEFTQLGCKILVGVSRKSMIGTILNKPVDQRLYGGLALAVIAVNKGANIIRTHDVAPTVDALKITHAVLNHARN
jgi:dihydropteroate synthase